MSDQEKKLALVINALKFSPASENNAAVSQDFLLSPRGCRFPPKPSLSLPPKRESDRFSAHYPVTPLAFWKHPLVKVLQRFIPPESADGGEESGSFASFHSGRKILPSSARRSRPGKLSPPSSLFQDLRLDHPRFSPKVNLIQKRRDFVTRFPRALSLSSSLLFLFLSLSISLLSLVSTTGFKNAESTHDPFAELRVLGCSFTATEICPYLFSSHTYAVRHIAGIHRVQRKNYAVTPAREKKLLNQRLQEWGLPENGVSEIMERKTRVLWDKRVDKVVLCVKLGSFYRTSLQKILIENVLDIVDSILFARRNFIRNTTFIRYGLR